MLVECVNNDVRNHRRVHTNRGRGRNVEGMKCLPPAQNKKLPLALSIMQLETVDPRWSEVVRDGQRWSEVVRGGHRWSQVVRGGQRWSERADHKELGVICTPAALERPAAIDIR